MNIFVYASLWPGLLDIIIISLFFFFFFFFFEDKETKAQVEELVQGGTASERYTWD